LDGVRSSVSDGGAGECALPLFDLFEAPLGGPQAGRRRDVGGLRIQRDRAAIRIG
jgi:hypothetical protein